MLNLYVYPLNQNGVEVKFLSFVEPTLAQQGKLNKHTIIGKLIDGNLPVEHNNISYNPDFVDFFHKTIVFTSLNSVAFVEAAKMQQSGFVYITDQRVENSQNKEDIVGSFEVKNGTIIESSYLPSANYQMISHNGLFKLTAEFEAVLVNALVGSN